VSESFKAAGAQHPLLSESGLELLRLASGGKPRFIYRILSMTLELAMKKNLNHLPR
jgi:MSHA biogenesis protein MshM